MDATLTKAASPQLDKENRFLLKTILCAGRRWEPEASGTAGGTGTGTRGMNERHHSAPLCLCISWKSVTTLQPSTLPVCVCVCVFTMLVIDVCS